MTRYEVAGTTDENTICDCCGKSNLKMTVVLRDDEGEFRFFGRSCAALATGRKASVIDREILAANHAASIKADQIAVWAAYLAEGDAGVDRFIAGNRIACERFWPTREAVAAKIATTYAELVAA